MSLLGFRAARASLALACCAGALAACGGDDENTPDATATAATRPTVEVLPTPVVTGDSIFSTAHGYRASVPQGWRVSGNFIAGQTGGGDAFFAPEGANPDPANNVMANIAVVCEPIGDAMGSLDAYIEKKVELLTSLGRQNIVVADHPPVAGVVAKQVSYAFQKDQIAFEKSEIFLLTGACLWSVALTTQPGQNAVLRPQLDTVLNSLQFSS